MARTPVAPTQLLGDAPVEYVSMAGDAVNGHSIAKARLAFLRIENAGASPCVATILPGNHAAGAFQSHVKAGLSVTVPAGETRVIGELESSRFSQGTDYWLDLDQASGVTLGAVYLPGGA